MADKSTIKAAREFLIDAGYHKDYQSDFYAELLSAFADEQVKAETADLRERLAKYEAMDDALQIGTFNLPTGVVPFVRKGIKGRKLSVGTDEHDSFETNTAIEAFAALTKLQENK